MSTELLVVFYLCAGVAVAGMIVARGPRRLGTIASAAVAVPLWPLWAPFALAPERAAENDEPAPAAACRVTTSLRVARSRIAHGELDALLSDRDVDVMCSAVHRLRRRRHAIVAEVERVSATAGTEPTPRQAARLARPEEALAREDAALAEIGELADALASELTLASCGQGDGVAGLVAELSARVDALAAG